MGAVASAYVCEGQEGVQAEGDEDGRRSLFPTLFGASENPDQERQPS